MEDPEKPETFNHRPDRLVTSLVEQFGPKVHKVSLRILRDEDEAKDNTQDTFFQVLLHADQIEARMGYLEPWILRIAINQAINKVSASKRKATTSLEAKHEETNWDPLDEKESFVEQVEMRDEVERLLEKLGQSGISKSREAVQAMILQSCGFSSKEIGQIIGMSEAAVNNLLHSGRKKMQGDRGGKGDQGES